MQSSQDSGKFVIGSLLVFGVLAVVAYLVLHNISSYIDSAGLPAAMDETSINERLQPVGEVNIGEEPVAVAATDSDGDSQQTASADDGALGKQVVTQSCAACHGSGLMNSPRVGSASDWAPRLEQGMDTLYDHAINGFNLMPARGGNARLTDEEVKAAVDYMVASQ